ncbi:MAG: hypothetical protein KFF50_16005, partial [Desulfatitalea sp.]|nr:hypothetical protein [Desulfatitalea sp.]
APYDSVCSTFLETNAALAMAKKHNSLRFYAHIPMLIRSPVFRQMPHGDHLQCWGLGVKRVVCAAGI